MKEEQQPFRQKGDPRRGNSIGAERVKKSGLSGAKQSVKEWSGDGSRKGVRFKC